MMMMMTMMKMMMKSWFSGLTVLLTLGVLVVACGDDECPGQKTGACGLADTCVECLTNQDCTAGIIAQSLSTRDSLCTSDMDCAYPQVCIDRGCYSPKVCSLAGECVVATYCYGESGTACGDGTVCNENWCQPTCATDQDCQAGLGTCLPIGACSYQRCTEDRTCPAGTEPVAGSLACAPVN